MRCYYTTLPVRHTTVDACAQGSGYSSSTFWSFLFLTEGVPQQMDCPISSDCATSSESLLFVENAVRSKTRAAGLLYKYFLWTGRFWVSGIGRDPQARRGVFTCSQQHITYRIKYHLYNLLDFLLVSRAFLVFYFLLITRRCRPNPTPTPIFIPTLTVTS